MSTNLSAKLFSKLMATVTSLAYGGFLLHLFCFVVNILALSLTIIYMLMR